MAYRVKTPIKRKTNIRSDVRENERNDEPFVERKLTNGLRKIDDNLYIKKNNAKIKALTLENLPSLIK